MNRVLVLSGACGSGKSTIAQLLAEDHGWLRVSEDDVWKRQFQNDRGRIGTDEHRRKRVSVRREVVDTVCGALGQAEVVIDATVHDTDPSSVREYEELFDSSGVSWQIRVLHPELEVVIERDATRNGLTLGAHRVERLWRKFSGQLFDPRVFLDTSVEEPRETAQRVLASLAMKLPTSIGPSGKLAAKDVS